MYVDENPTDDDTTTDTDTTDTTDTDTDTGQDDLVVEIDGEEYHVEENADLDGDGKYDTAVVETEDGYLAFADTDGDGVGDVAVQYDEDGNVVAGAEYDETTGEWHREDVESLPTPTGDGADDANPSDDSSTDTTDTGDDSTTSSGGDMTVDLPGEDVNVGPATYDTDGDGEEDTAVVTDSDGTTYAFTDEDGDGEADSAVVIEADGDVTVMEHTGEDQWTTTETGQINEDGTYEPDYAASDAAWSER